MLPGLDQGMENDRLDVVPSLWPVAIRWVLSHLALVAIVALSAADPKPSSIGLRGIIQPEVSNAPGELYPAYASPTLG